MAIHALVEGDAPGLSRRPMSKFGRRVGDNAAEMVFDNVRLPPGRILPPAPKGRTDMGTHPTIAALTLGLGRAAYEETLRYTQERISGGKPIIQHQAVGIAIADMAMNLQAARRLGFRLMPFNLVVSTNTAGIRCWQCNGFQVVGTLPGAFRHQRLGYVDALVMVRALVEKASP